MAFDAVFAQVIELLQRQGWASYRTLRRRFGLDEATLAALTQALLDTQPVTVDDTGTRLVWQGELRPTAAPTRTWDVVPSVPSVAGAAPWPLVRDRRRGLSPLVGREHEVRLLLARWAQVQAGQGQVVALSGEAGIGKSRLVQVVTTHVAGTPHGWWACHGVPTAQYSAFAPVMDLLQQVLDYQPDDPPATKRHKLEATLAAYSLPLPEAVPLLAALLAVPLEDRYPPLTLTPERQRQRTLETVLTVLRGLAAEQPVLLIVEDLHWVDPSTLELLGLLVAQAATACLYVLLTWRPEFQPSWPPLAYQTTLTLGRLLPTQVEALATHVARGKALPPTVLAQIVARTEGVPLFVEEVTKMVLASGLVREEADHYELTGALPPLAIPATLYESLLARLEGLGAAKPVAQVGAVWGRAFTEAQLQAVVPLDRRRLEQAVGRLMEADILREVSLPPRVTYIFKHALIQDAAYESMPEAMRRTTHTQIAQVLEERFPATVETQPELPAYHYTEAGLYAQALPYWQRAGQRAMQRPAYREAVVCFERALHVLRQLPESRDTRTQAFDFCLNLRHACFSLQEYERTFAALCEAETLAETLADPYRLGLVTNYLGHYFWVIADASRAVRYGQRAVDIASGLEDVGLQIVARTYLGAFHYSLGNYRQAVRGLETALTSLGGEARQAWGTPVPPAVLARVFLALCLAELGAFSEARTYGEEGMHLAEELDHPRILNHACWGVGPVYLCQGDFPRAIVVLERGLRAAERYSPTSFPNTAAPLG